MSTDVSCAPARVAQDPPFTDSYRIQTEGHDLAVGRKLKALRAQHQVSMNKVHLETRMSTSYLSKLERDEFVPGPDNLQKIVDALKTLNVDGAEALIAEHEAVKREREALAELEARLTQIDDPDQRIALLNEFMKKVPAPGRPVPL